MKKNFISKAFILIFVFFLLSSIFHLLASNLHAQSQIFRVSPVILNITLSPGKSYSYEAKIENLIDTPLPIKVSLDSLTPDEEGAPPPSIVSWIDINETEMIIPAKTTRKVQIIINTPRVISLGGYYGIIYFEPVLAGISRISPNIAAKVGTLVLANIGVQDNQALKGEIVSFDTDKFIYEKNPVNFSFKVKNTSLNHFSAKTFINVSSLFGNLKEVESGEKIILPGKTRNWQIELAVPSCCQIFYKATLSVSSGGGNIFTKTGYFVLFPFSKLVIVILLILLGYFIIKRKNRIKRAVIILLKNK